AAAAATAEAAAATACAVAAGSLAAAAAAANGQHRTGNYHRSLRRYGDSSIGGTAGAHAGRAAGTGMAGGGPAAAPAGNVELAGVVISEVVRLPVEVMEMVLTDVETSE